MTASAKKPRIEIVYCTQCRWLLRAAWMAYRYLLADVAVRTAHLLMRGTQELLTTFESEIGEVALVPGTGGIFEVRANGTLAWSRIKERRFHEITELKQKVRDVIAPGKDLGHADRK